MRSTKGQILPLGLMVIVTLVFLWVLLLDVGKLIKDQIQLQIAADTAAQSACAIRARGLNAIGRMNSWLGTPVLGIGIPQAAWWAVPIHAMDHRMVAGQLAELQDDLKKVLDLLKEGPKTQAKMVLLQLLFKGGVIYLGGAYDIHPKTVPNFAKAQKTFIATVRYLQTAYNRAYGGGRARHLVQNIARAQGADDIYAPHSSYSLHLQANHGPIWYLSTLHTWIQGKPVPMPIPFLPQGDDSMEGDTTTQRWYEQGPDFNRQSQRIYVYRRASSPLNGRFPLGQHRLHIQMPDLAAVAAARAYNPRGPMFPTSSQTRGAMGGVAAQRAYTHAAERWRTQLVPVGGFYDH